MGNTKATVRCVIYTRKSVEEGLDMEFNSLDAQRLAGENYIASQKYNGWICLPDRYDDGGFSGGTLDRPAMQRLLQDAKDGKFDVIVVYKIDRLSRSICDFAELSKILDEYNVSFVSVTQEINTSTSSGRMMLNILMTFAQYEREVITERVRDKMTATRKRGQWIGGRIPFGYKLEDKHLLIDPQNAEEVKWIYKRFLEIQELGRLANELNEREVFTQYGDPWTVSSLKTVLLNREYIGEIDFKGSIYTGEQPAILDKELWDDVQDIFLNKYIPNPTGGRKRNDVLLSGILRCGHCGGMMTPNYAYKNKKKYCYYVCIRDIKRSKSICPIRRVSAGAIEKIVLDEVGTILKQPTFVSRIANELDEDPYKTMETLNNMSNIWDNIFPAEQARLIKMLIDNVTLTQDEAAIKLKTAGAKSLIQEIISNEEN